MGEDRTQQGYGFIAASHLADFEEGDAPPAVGGESTIPAGSVIANSRFVVSLAAAIDDTSAAFTCDGVVCAVRIRHSIDMCELASGSVNLESLVESRTSRHRDMPGRWLHEVWDLVGPARRSAGRRHSASWAPRLSGAAVENATIIGKTARSTARPARASSRSSSSTRPRARF